MQEISLENLPRHKHEYWVLEGMLPLGGGVIKRKVAIRPKLECDAIIRMELPDIFWAELAGWIAWHPKGTSSQASLLRARDVVVEHFPDSIGGWEFHTCSTKRSACARDYYRPGQTNRPRREPCLVVFRLQRAMREMDQVLQEKDQVLQEKDQVLQKKDQVLQEKELAIKQRDEELRKLRKQLEK